MNLKMRRLTWFMLKHCEGKAHWNDEERPWNSFLLSNVQQDGMLFIFIVHHPSIVFQSMNIRTADAICMLIISLAVLWAETCYNILSKRNSETEVWMTWSCYRSFISLTKEPCSLLRIFSTMARQKLLVRPNKIKWRDMSLSGIF